MKSAMETFKGKNSHYILCSSIAVYPDWNRKKPYIENEAHLEPVHKALTENEKLLENYANSKRAGEQFLLSNKTSDFSFTIMRPAVIEGPDDYTNRTWYWVQRVMDDNPLLIPDATLQHVYVEDVADAFIKAANNPVAFGQIYNVAGDDFISVHDYVEHIGLIMNKEVQTYLVDDTYKGQIKFPDIYDDSFLVDNNKIKKDLNIHFTPIKSWLPITVEWCLNNCKENSLGYENRQQEIQLSKELAPTTLRNSR